MEDWVKLEWSKNGIKITDEKEKKSQVHDNTHRQPTHAHDTHTHTTYAHHQDA